MSSPHAPTRPPDGPRRTEPPAESANERFKRGFPARLWSSILAATLLHFALFALWPTMSAPVLGVEGEEEMRIVPPPPLELPEPPPPLARPVPPIDPTAELSEEVTIPPTVWPDREQDPPPPPARVEREATRHGRVVPVEVRPELRNPEEVRRALLREYPGSYQEAGIGGTVMVEFHLAEDGSVLETGIAVSSGHAPLDRAALRVAEICRFRPALNRDRGVSVWVTFAMVFEAR